MLCCIVLGNVHAARGLSFRWSALAVIAIFHNAAASMLATLAHLAGAVPISTVFVVSIVRNAPPHDSLILFPTHVMHLFHSSYKGFVPRVQFSLRCLRFVTRVDGQISSFDECSGQFVSLCLSLFVDSCLFVGLLPQGRSFLAKFIRHVPGLLNMAFIKADGRHTHGKVFAVSDACATPATTGPACPALAIALAERLTTAPSIDVGLLLVVFVCVIKALLLTQNR
mmetsp:Transcript_40369/g.79741  ORF Transcript_40369/g.79741 Transcript_40369/m.79741 type:complete len:225 (-) Transcript_40369:353-1027(-)